MGKAQRGTKKQGGKDAGRRGRGKADRQLSRRGSSEMETC